MPEDTNTAQPAPEQSAVSVLTPLKQRSNGIAVPGLVLAILVWPAGLVLSVIALVRARSRGGAGRTAAILGLTFSIILAATTVTFALIGTLKTDQTAPVDPGCAAAKAPALVIQDASIDSVRLENAAVQIHNDAAKAKSPQLKVTLDAIYNDTLLYIQQLRAATTSLVPAQQLQQNLDDLDQFCNFPSP